MLNAVHDPVRTMNSDENEPGKELEARAVYRDVRSLARGLRLIEALSQSGWTRPGALAAAARLDRSSTYRLANTLIEQGFVERRREDGALALTSKIRRIADGVRGDELLLGRAGPHLAALTAEISWPSDFAMLAGGSVTIQDSTHSLSPITFHRATIHQERSLLDTALGRAIMTVLTPVELDAALDIAVAVDGPDCGRDIDRRLLRDTLAGYRLLGYAWAAGAVDPNVTAIARGFRGRDGLVGAVNIVFFRRVLSPVAAAERYLANLVRCVGAIAAEA